MAESLHNAPIVLDNGSGTIRAGFAGEDAPKCFFPSWVGRPKHLRVLAGALEGDVFIGQKAATELRGLLKIRYPLEHGIVTDWDDMERIWEYVYGEGLKTLSEEVRGQKSRLAIWCVTTDIVCIAPRPIDGTAPEPTKQPRHRRPDPLRDLQRPRPAHLHPGRPLPLRQRPDDGHRARLGRRRLACRSRLRGVCYAEQHPPHRRGGPRRDRVPADAAAQERIYLPHERGEGGGAVD